MANAELFYSITSQNSKAITSYNETLDFFKEEIKNIVKKIYYSKDEFIAKEGLKDDYIYLIERGKVILTRKDLKDKEHTHGYLMPGEFFGISSIIDMTHTSNYKALTNCSIYAIDKDYLKDYMEKHPEFNIVFNKILINAMRSFTRRQGNLMMGGCRSTFTNFVVEHFNDFGRIDDEGNVLVTLDVNLSEIALILNMTRETLSRVIAEMRKEGIIETKRRFIKILDLQRFVI